MTNAKKVSSPVVEAATASIVGFTVLTRETLLTTTKAIEDAINEAKTTAQKAEALYQLAACSAAVHLATHHDIRVIRNLLDTLPEGMRKQSMSAWFDRYTSVSFDDEGKVGYNEEKKLDLNGALNMPWWKAKKEEVYHPFNELEELNKFIAKLEKRFVKADADKGDKITSTLINQLRQVRNNLVKTENEAPISETETQEQIAA